MLRVNFVNVPLFINTCNLITKRKDTCVIVSFFCLSIYIYKLAVYPRHFHVTVDDYDQLTLTRDEMKTIIGILD